jgi:2-succinyl-6-hydroxy-2,4-cyclohexadiene-1-carboxylate synthase
MGSRNIIALHGFLGLPTDWHSWRKHLGPHENFLAINLWSDPLLNSSLTFAQWTDSFVTFVANKFKPSQAIELWGYSMGGRLALSALNSAPALFSKAVIVSANPGLESEIARKLRAANDVEWAQRFETQNWQDLVHDWNSQLVFQAPTPVDNSVNRLETHFKRAHLAQALRNWSIAHQPNFWPGIEKINIPVDWHVGEFDKTYLEIGQRAESLNSKIKLKIHPGCGHRLL